MLFVAGFAVEAEARALGVVQSETCVAGPELDTQQISASQWSAVHNASQTDLHCCVNNFCFNAGHCHHCAGAAAVILPHAGSHSVSLEHSDFGLSAQCMPLLSLFYPLIDPPRA